jgi:hypothetical protein
MAVTTESTRGARHPWRRGRTFGAVALTLALALPTTLGAGEARAEGGNPRAFSFIAMVNGEPVHWDMCRNIRYRVNLRGAPPGALREIKEAIGRVSSTSGLRFKYAGRTRVSAWRFSRYPDDTRFIVDWAGPDQIPEFGGNVVGIGGPLYNTGTGEIARGAVVFNVRYNDVLEDGFGRGYTKGELYMHEIAHAVGLGHVGDRHQIMYSSMTRSRAVWGEGDKNGLVRVGRRRPCFPSFIAGTAAADAPDYVARLIPTGLRTG